MLRFAILLLIVVASSVGLVLGWEHFNPAAPADRLTNHPAHGRRAGPHGPALRRVLPQGCAYVNRLTPPGPTSSPTMMSTMPQSI